MYTDQVKEAKEVIYNMFNKAWIMSTGEPAFIELLKESRNLDDLHRHLKQNIETTLSNVNTLWKQIIEARIRYNTLYQMKFR